MSDFNITDNVVLYCIEPPCGSNTYVLQINGKLLFIDSGFTMYKPEMTALLSGIFGDITEKRLTAFLTHSDVDHIGLWQLFDRICMSGASYLNFENEKQGKPAVREQNPFHAPYCVLSKIISGYVTPDLSRLEVVGERTGDGVLVSKTVTYFYGHYSKSISTQTGSI